MLPPPEPGPGRDGGGWPGTPQLTRYLLLFASAWATILWVNYFAGAIALFTTAALLAALLHVPVVRLSRFLPRGLAIAVVFLAALGLLAVLFTALGIQIMAQGEGLLLHLGDALQRGQGEPLRSWLERLETGTVTDTLRTGLATGLQLLKHSFAGVFTALFGAVITLYMLIDGERLWLWTISLLPERHRARVALAVRRSFLGFLRGQLLLMLFLTLGSYLVFMLLQVKYALLLALIVGVVDAIPGIGATLGIATAFVLILSSQGWPLAGWALAACLVLVQIQDNLLRPRVMAGALELHPVLLFAALFVGQRVAGLLGIFLAVPVAGMVAILVSSLRQEGDSPALPPHSP